jgi:hypothetical protein
LTPGQFGVIEQKLFGDCSQDKADYPKLSTIVALLAQAVAGSNPRHRVIERALSIFWG